MPPKTVIHSSYPGYRIDYRDTDGGHVSELIGADLRRAERRRDELRALGLSPVVRGLGRPVLSAETPRRSA